MSGGGGVGWCAECLGGAVGCGCVLVCSWCGLFGSSGLAIAVRRTVCVGWWGVAGGMLLCADGGVGPGSPGWVGLGAGCVCAGRAGASFGVPGGLAGCDGGFLGAGGRSVVGVAGRLVFGVCSRGRVFRACLLVWAGRGGVGWECCSWWLDCLLALVAVGGPVEMVPAVSGQRQWWRGACVSGGGSQAIRGGVDVVVSGGGGVGWCPECLGCAVWCGCVLVCSWCRPFGSRGLAIAKEGPYQDRPPLCPFRLLPLLIYSGSVDAFLKFQRVQRPKI